MNKFKYGDSFFHLTNKFENITQAQETCSSNGSVIANLRELNFEDFIVKFIRDQASNLKSFIYLRVHPVNHTLDECYGLLDLIFLNADDGLDRNVDDVCNNSRFLTGKYKTLCSQKIKKDTESLMTYVIIGVSVISFVAICFGLLVCFMEKRQSTETRQQIEGHNVSL